MDHERDIRGKCRCPALLQIATVGPICWASRGNMFLIPVPVQQKPKGPCGIRPLLKACPLFLVTDDAFVD
jgi:hypothetical protein